MPVWLMNYMWRAKQPYNVSVVAEVAACAALDNPAYLKVSQVKNRNIPSNSHESVESQGFACARTRASVPETARVQLSDAVSISVQFYFDKVR